MAETAISTFQYAEWTGFRDISSLPQKAGVPANRIRRLVLKELTDNALDAGGKVEFGKIDGSYFVQDDGPGIDPDQIANLFSINRDHMTSKLWRLPTRGALGNGLRVVAGAVLASDGDIVVYTRDRRIKVALHDNGTATTEIEPWDFPTGTRIELRLGDKIPSDGYPFDRVELCWAELAARVGHQGTEYLGKPSPHWYSPGPFWELLQAAGDRPVSDLVGDLDGCGYPKSVKIAEEFKARACASLSKRESEELLERAKAESRPVNAKRLGAVGNVPNLEPHYAKTTGTFESGRAKIPFVVEVWADADDVEDTAIDWMVNRSPIVGDVYTHHDKTELYVEGCGILKRPKLGKRKFIATINVTTPYCPITSDSKAPDLSVFWRVIEETLTKAVRKAGKATPKDGGETQKAIIYRYLDEGVAMASGDGRYRFNQRQLFYVIRPYLIDALDREPAYNTFTAAITGYENEHGDIPGMYRDARGTLYHPHSSETISLGTLNVEGYERPEWTFNKVLYIEKEGFFESLKADQWPERHDCAIMGGKGYSTRATKDLLDYLGDTDEPLTVFCIHDADAAGTMIYQTLQEETRARGARNVTIINLGLEPWEAVEMGLAVETVTYEKKKAVADYVSLHPVDPPDGGSWSDWLQNNRIELNAMTTPQFLEWLDGKMRGFDGKVVPPESVLDSKLAEQIEKQYRDKIQERILREAGFEDQVKAAVEKTARPDAATVREQVESILDEDRTKPWTAPIEDLADQITVD